MHILCTNTLKMGKSAPKLVFDVREGMKGHFLWNGQQYWCWIWYPLCSLIEDKYSRRVSTPHDLGQSLDPLCTDLRSSYIHSKFALCAAPSLVISWSFFYHLLCACYMNNPCIFIISWEDGLWGPYSEVGVLGFQPLPLIPGRWGRTASSLFRQGSLNCR